MGPTALGSIKWITDMTDDNSLYSMSYRDVAIHKAMLQDVVRTDAYEKALRQVVKPGFQVLDFGCGTGILSIFAARAGAEQVYALDRSLFIQIAHSIARGNGFDNIAFFHDDDESFTLDRRVDVIVSEWMGHFLFYEAMLRPLLRLRDRFLADGGIMIPARVSLHAGLLSDASLFENLSFFRERPYGVNFAPIEDAPLCQPELENIEPGQILESRVDLGTLDLQTLKLPPGELVGKVVPDRVAMIYGLCGWFSANLTPGVAFGTGPQDPPTHWNQVLFPLTKPFQVSPDREITVRIRPPDETAGGESTWSWSISDKDQHLRMDERDYRHQLNPYLPKGPLRDLI